MNKACRLRRMLRTGGESWIRRMALLGVLGLLSACDAISSPAAVTVPRAVPAMQARYGEDPKALFAGLALYCSGPAFRYQRTTRHDAQCDELLSPQMTAAMILEFDGTIEDLPRLVLRFIAKPDAGGFVVSNQTYVLVPQQRGGALRIYYTDRNLRKKLTSLYRETGGAPL